MNKLPQPATNRVGFGADFRRFFVRGLAALLPTLITLWLLIKVWDFLWESLGQYLIIGVRWIYLQVAGDQGFPPAAKIARDWDVAYNPFRTKLVGVTLAIILVYFLGVFVGNFIGRALYRLGELAVMRIPLVRAIYPAVKQVTDFLLAERSGQFESSRVVAVQPHTKGIWSIGLVTGAQGIRPLSDAVGQEMVTVFVPSSPTAFSGYVLVVPRDSLVELPLTVEEAMRLLVSGGVLTPKPPAELPTAEVHTPAGGFPVKPASAEQLTIASPSQPAPGARLANE
ncbi:MAG: hypothetical protein JWL69_4561 [Phycisphaerales bacterium]|jgi:uncharacterized membrane protein|nr:hypothetical protein [Phycisphaerales bacterium]